MDDPAIAVVLSEGVEVDGDARFVDDGRPIRRYIQYDPQPPV
jgi:hypothetical protein